MVPAVTTTAIMTRTQTMPRILAVIAALWRTVVSAGQLGKKTHTLKVYNVNYIRREKILNYPWIINLRNDHDENYFRSFCRYITILYFLNDVEEGGHTAFPIADSDATFKQQVCTFNCGIIKVYGSEGKLGTIVSGHFSEALCGISWVLRSGKLLQFIHYIIQQYFPTLMFSSSSSFPLVFFSHGQGNPITSPIWVRIAPKLTWGLNQNEAPRSCGIITW